jgi:hypothetical protein
VKENDWELIAPLGELPDEEALREVAAALEALERPYRARKLPGASLRDYVGLLKELLEEVRGTEGVFKTQRDGGGVKKGIPKVYRSWRDIPSSSVLAVAGVRGEASAYLVHYERSKITRQGGARNAVNDLWRELRNHLATRKELEALEKKLFQRYPPLKEIASEVLGSPPAFAGIVERGQVIFPITVWGYAAHALVGKEVLRTPLIDFERVRKAQEEELAREIGEGAFPQALSPEAIRNLLRGGGDVEEAERSIALARLATF